MNGKPNRTVAWSLALALVAGLAACGSQRAGDDVQADQTKFPGQVSAGGGTSGEVIARGMQASGAAAPATPAPSGTPGTPQGAEGNVGGAELGGTVPKETELGGSGEKTPEQASKPPPATEPELSTAPPAPEGAASR